MYFADLLPYFPPKYLSSLTGMSRCTAVRMRNGDKMLIHVRLQHSLQLIVKLYIPQLDKPLWECWSSSYCINRVKEKVQPWHYVSKDRRVGRRGKNNNTSFIEHIWHNSHIQYICAYCVYKILKIYYNTSF